jgi:hypothetical protein
MEMTAVWEERKSKSPFPLFPHCLGKLANNSDLPTFPQPPATTWDFLFLQARLTSTSTKSVTYMPRTFCYRHPRSHRASKTTALAPEVRSLSRFRSL